MKKKILKSFALLTMVVASCTERQIYNHVNWGWDGRSNGYFLSNIFNVGNAEYGILTSMGTNGMLEALEAMGYQASVASYTSDILKESFRINNSPIIIGGIKSLVAGRWGKNAVTC